MSIRPKASKKDVLSSLCKDTEEKPPILLEIEEEDGILNLETVLNEDKQDCSSPKDCKKVADKPLKPIRTYSSLKTDEASRKYHRYSASYSKTLPKTSLAGLRAIAKLIERSAQQQLQMKSSASGVQNKTKSPDRITETEVKFCNKQNRMTETDVKFCNKDDKILEKEEVSLDENCKEIKEEQFVQLYKRNPELPDNSPRTDDQTADYNDFEKPIIESKAAADGLFQFPAEVSSSRHITMIKQNKDNYVKYSTSTFVNTFLANIQMNNNVQESNEIPDTQHSRDTQKVSCQKHLTMCKPVQAEIDLSSSSESGLGNDKKRLLVTIDLDTCSKSIRHHGKHKEEREESGKCRKIESNHCSCCFDRSLIKSRHKSRNKLKRNSKSPDILEAKDERKNKPKREKTTKECKDNSPGKKLKKSVTHHEVNSTLKKEKYTNEPSLLQERDSSLVSSSQSMDEKICKKADKHKHKHHSPKHLSRRERHENIQTSKCMCSASSESDSTELEKVSKSRVKSEKVNRNGHSSSPESYKSSCSTFSHKSSIVSSNITKLSEIVDIIKHQNNNNNIKGRDTKHRHKNKNKNRSSDKEVCSSGSSINFKSTKHSKNRGSDDNLLDLDETKNKKAPQKSRSKNVLPKHRGTANEENDNACGDNNSSTVQDGSFLIKFGLEDEEVPKNDKDFSKNDIFFTPRLQAGECVSTTIDDTIQSRKEANSQLQPQNISDNSSVNPKLALTLPANKKICVTTKDISNLCNNGYVNSVLFTSDDKTGKRFVKDNLGGISVEPANTTENKLTIEVSSVFNCIVQEYPHLKKVLESMLSNNSSENSGSCLKLGSQNLEPVKKASPPFTEQNLEDINKDIVISSSSSEDLEDEEMLQNSQGTDSYIKDLSSLTVSTDQSMPEGINNTLIEVCENICNIAKQENDVVNEITNLKETLGKYETFTNKFKVLIETDSDDFHLQKEVGLIVRTITELNAQKSALHEENQQLEKGIELVRTEIRNCECLNCTKLKNDIKVLKRKIKKVDDSLIYLHGKSTVKMVNKSVQINICDDGKK